MNRIHGKAAQFRKFTCSPEPLGQGSATDGQTRPPSTSVVVEGSSTGPQTSAVLGKPANKPRNEAILAMSGGSGADPG